MQRKTKSVAHISTAINHHDGRSSACSRMAEDRKTVSAENEKNLSNHSFLKAPRDSTKSEHETGKVRPQSDPTQPTV
jgi:hypothetical protein